jgi:hypothetical protein
MARESTFSFRVMQAIQGQTGNGDCLGAKVDIEAEEKRPGSIVFIAGNIIGGLRERKFEFAAVTKPPPGASGEAYKSNGDRYAHFERKDRNMYAYSQTADGSKKAQPRSIQN